MLNGVNLPEEIVLDILFRLPTKSLGRCKCVSKPWRTRISDPNFIQTRRPQKHVLLVDEGSLFVVEFPGEPLFGADKIAFPVRLNFQSTYKWHRAYCSFKGLVLALNSNDELFILNPTTREFKKLPELSCRAGLAYKALLGFGYDSTTDDYKVVVISCHNEVYVYRLKSDTWVSLPDSPPNHAQPYNESGVFLNNSLHWFGEISSQTSISAHSSILTFDLADEKFREVPLPSQFDGFNKRVLRTLGVVDGCLCIVCKDYLGKVNGGVVDGCLCIACKDKVNGRVDVWIMKEYGVEGSWTKISFYQDIAFLNPIYFWGNEEFVLITGKAKVAIINMKEESLTNIFICGIQSEGSAKAVVHCTFMDSLVSPKCLHQGTDS